MIAAAESIASLPSSVDDVAMPRYDHVRWSLLNDWRANVTFPDWQVSDCLLDHLPDNMEDNVGPPQLDIASAVSAVTTNASTSPEQVRDAAMWRLPWKSAVRSRE